MTTSTSIFDRIESYGMINDEYTLIESPVAEKAMLEAPSNPCFYIKCQPKCFDCLVNKAIATLTGMTVELNERLKQGEELKRELAKLILDRAQTDEEVRRLTTVTRLQQILE